jgi:phosphoglycolate phosphatase-like HAD superfamily hydrolase
MKVKAVIFDFDDTLTDNKRLDLESFRYLGRILGLYVPSAREIKELRKTLLAKDIISWMIKKSARSVPLDLCLKIRNDFLRKENERLIIVKPKVRSALQKLKSEGCSLFIATTRTDIGPVKAILRKHRVERFFKNVYSKDSGDKIDIYKKILLDPNLVPGECMVVSNSFQDLSQALDLGMKAVGVHGSYGVDPALRGNMEVLEDLSKLVFYVKKHCD